MSITIDTTVDIDASKQAVWDVLTDFAAYGEWNPFLRIEGTAEVGTKLVVHMSGGGEHGMSVRPKGTGRHTVRGAALARQVRLPRNSRRRTLLHPGNQRGWDHPPRARRALLRSTSRPRKRRLGEERHRVRGLQPGPQAARRKLALPAMTSSSRTSQARQTVAPTSQPVVTTAASQRRLANPGVARCRGRPPSACRSGRSYREFL
jgi:uncharacterized protein YndB with AHSA1/START domain